MNLEESIIDLYLRLASAYEGVIGDKRIRARGFPPDLSDAEVVTIEIFSERQGHHEEKAMQRHIRNHWPAWFSKLPRY